MAAIIKWIIVVLAVLNFGFMAFDGTRALTKGDYIRPASGAHAGQLGPWAKLATRVGINPESTTMKFIFVLWGLCGLAFTTAFIFGAAWSLKALLILNVLSLWYLIPGTVSSIIQLILLFVFRRINH